MPVVEATAKIVYSATATATVFDEVASVASLHMIDATEAKITEQIEASVQL